MGYNPLRLLILPSELTWQPQRGQCRRELFRSLKGASARPAIPFAGATSYLKRAGPAFPAMELGAPRGFAAVILQCTISGNDARDFYRDF